MFLSYKTINRKIIIKIKDRICETPDELLSSPMFKTLLKNSIKQLETKGSPLLELFGSEKMSVEMLNDFIEMLKFLTKIEGRLVPNVLPGARVFLKNKHLLNEFVEYVYNYWRSFDRFIICDSTGSNL
ncbi:MAG TPA: hypothetical protein VLJ10_00875, partial [Candidatus Bathyarchaeia archaeon]|nr:hypothetical protein [Candidatus Bathyarchaeia archaeon]